MPKLSVQKSVLIERPVKQVHDVVAHFDYWQPWSPWLIAEKDAKVTVTNQGKFYAWEGNRIGAGEMEVVKETEDKIDYKLIFLKPWKSKADVSFILKEQQGSTLVTWTMSSSLPFFLFFMKKKLEVFIGMDYERGLKMLKEYVEENEVFSKVECLGRQSYAGCKYIGISTETTMNGIGESMTKDFTTLYNFAQAKGIEITNNPFSQYHTFDLVNNKVSYTSAVPVHQLPTELPPNIKTGELPASELETVRHTGSYNHLGNAWSTIMMMKQNKEFKENKAIHPLEFYLNDPADTPERELITDVSFAVK